jgi:hypothetical protein
MWERRETMGRYFMKLDNNLLKELKRHFQEKYPNIDFGIELLINVYNSGYPNGALITYFTPDNGDLLNIELHDEDMIITTISEEGDRTFSDFLKTKNAKVTKM